MSRQEDEEFDNPSNTMAIMQSSLQSKQLGSNLPP
jgi:hypothetical protein